MGRWNSDRWEPAGTNSAGDPMYKRNSAGGGSGAAVTSSSQMSKDELKALAESRGLPTSGTKADLLDRLSGVGT